MSKSKLTRPLLLFLSNANIFTSRTCNTTQNLSHYINPSKPMFNYSLKPHYFCHSPSPIFQYQDSNNLDETELKNKNLETEYFVKNKNLETEYAVKNKNLEDPNLEKDIIRPGFDDLDGTELENKNLEIEYFAKNKNLETEYYVQNKNLETEYDVNNMNLEDPNLEKEVMDIITPGFDRTELENKNLETEYFVKNKNLETEVGIVMDIIRQVDREESCNVDVRKSLDDSGVSVSAELVTEVLSQVRNDWKPAFMFFKWAGKQPNYSHTYRHYHCMIAILGKMKRFDTAWALIGEMRNGEESMVTTQTLLIMIRRYSAVHDVDKAIKTFYAYKRFGFRVGVNEFYDLLSALCRYKNVKEAEVLLMSNKDVYPLTTKGFNILLNGWCNVIGSPREGKRIWWEMCNRGIARDVVSYSTIITCYSKSNETNEVIKIFDELKASRVKPDLKVYNGVIHVFCKAGLVEKARELLESMEGKGIRPNAITYNSIIMPLCKKGKTVDALKVFEEMLQRGLMPTVLTYHAFFRASKTYDEAISILQKMNQMGCFPNHDTYAMLIRKFSRWRHLENVWKLWDEMIINGLDPDRSSYVALVNGLFLNGKLDEAYKYHVEMKSKGLLPEPEMEETLQGWMAAKRTTEPPMVDSKIKCSDG